MAMHRFMALAVAALAIVGGAAAASARGRAATRPLPVRIAIPPIAAEQVAQSGRLDVDLHATRTARVRASVTFVSGEVSAGLYRRRVTLARGRTRRLRLVVPTPARAGLDRCATSRLLVSVKSGDRVRRAAQDIALGPPQCGRFFAPQSVWNKELAPDAPLDPASGEVVGALKQEVQREFASDRQPNINTTAYSAPIYTVTSGQATVPVALDGSDDSLARALAHVPLPDDARPATGTDAHLVLWQPSRDVMWEFWRLRRTSEGWRAGWGGRMDGVSTSPGFYDQAHSRWGATASRLSLAGGLMTIAELRRGDIPHALALAVPHPRANEYALPAQSTDGDSSSSSSIPEGARLRLDPRLDLDRLGLPPPTLALARAAQRYGILIRDAASNLAFYAEDPTPLGADPYPQIFADSPAGLLRLFPWQHLQLLRMDLRQEQPSRGPLPLP